MTNVQLAEIYSGTIYLDNPTLKHKLKSSALLDPNSKLLKFEYGCEVLRYQLEGGSVIQDSSRRKNISNFFSQRVKVKNERMHYVSFKFTDRETRLTFQVDGVLKSETG
jgi:hypothetical protein